MGVRVPIRDSLVIFSVASEAHNWNDYRCKVIKVVSQIQIENNWILLCIICHYMYQLAKDFVRASGRELTEVKQHHLQQNPNYISDNYISDEDIWFSTCWLLKYLWILYYILLYYDKIFYVVPNNTFSKCLVCNKIERFTFNTEEKSRTFMSKYVSANPSYNYLNNFFNFFWVFLSFSTLKLT